MSIVITQEMCRERCLKYGFTPISPYVSIKSKIEVMCNKHNVNFITTLDQIKRCKCPRCYEENRTKWQEENKLKNEDVDKRLGNRRIKRIGNVCGRHTKIEWECLDCGNRWFQTPGNVVHETNPTGCRKCDKACPDTKESFVEKLHQKGRNDIIFIGEYKSSQVKSLFKCEKCGFEWMAKPANVLNLGRGCPCCKFKSEKAVGDILNGLGISAEHNYYVKYNNKKFLIDWFIPDMKIAIEYHGEQHYRPISFAKYTKENKYKIFEEQQRRDAMLRDYCQINSIKLIEVDSRIYSHKDIVSMERYIINNVMGESYV